MAVTMLASNLILDRCPHCSVATPNLTMLSENTTRDHDGKNGRNWRYYICGRCGGVVTAFSKESSREVLGYFPENQSVASDIPERPRAYLQQACDCLHAPVGAVMLAASAVDAMLKAKGYPDGSLYSRIESAAVAHVITQDMAAWAHDVRLDANDQRHADESAALPSGEDAQRVIDFAKALAEILFVLPNRITRGRSIS